MSRIVFPVEDRVTCNECLNLAVVKIAQLNGGVYLCEDCALQMAAEMAEILGVG